MRSSSMMRMMRIVMIDDDDDDDEDVNYRKKNDCKEVQVISKQCINAYDVD